MRGWHKLEGLVSAGALVCLVVGWSPAGLAQGIGDAVTAEQLQEELAERDAVIIELLNRIEALEVERDSASFGGSPDQVDTRALVSDPGETAEDSSARDFDAEDLQAERALERGLVERGARLLAPGQVEFSPQLSLYHDEGMFPTALMDDDGTRIGEVERKLDLYERRADVRFGSPLGMQLEIGIPYLSADQQLATGIDGTIHSATKQSGYGDGDATLSLAKAFGAESSGGSEDHRAARLAYGEW